jgi:hypothetical protein
MEPAAMHHVDALVGFGLEGIFLVVQVHQVTFVGHRSVRVTIAHVQTHLAAAHASFIFIPPTEQMSISEFPVCIDLIPTRPRTDRHSSSGCNGKDTLSQGPHSLGNDQSWLLMTSKTACDLGVWCDILAAYTCACYWLRL